MELPALKVGKPRPTPVVRGGITARDLCQYGHIDDFCLQNIVKCRSGIKGVLSATDIQSFNAYLEDNNIPDAFKNSDWVRIYKRIVGDFRCSDTLAEWMKE